MPAHWLRCKAVTLITSLLPAYAGLTEMVLNMYCVNCGNCCPLVITVCNTIIAIKRRCIVFIILIGLGIFHLWTDGILIRVPCWCYLSFMMSVRSQVNEPVYGFDVPVLDGYDVIVRSRWQCGGAPICAVRGKSAPIVPVVVRPVNDLSPPV